MHAVLTHLACNIVVSQYLHPCPGYSPNPEVAFQQPWKGVFQGFLTFPVGSQSERKKTTVRQDGADHAVP